MALVWLVVTSTAAAQARLTTNDFVVDVIGTPVLGSSRIIGLSGAYTSLAEGVDGVPFNPAAYAARAGWELDWYEWELGGGIQFPGAFSTADYFLNGLGGGLGVDSFFALQFAGRLQFGDLGLGSSVEFQSFDLSGNPTSVGLTTFRVGGGYSLMRGQLVVGGGLRVLQLDVTDTDAVESLVNFTGFGAELGAILRLQDRPWRIGAAFRSPISAEIAAVSGNPMDPPTQVAGYTLPERVRSPWEVSIGASWQFLERPFNPRFIRPKAVGRGVLAELEREACARELEQVRREVGAAASAELSCPALRIHARDPAWRRAEALRSREERRRAAAEIATREEEMVEFWEALHESLPRRFVLVSADVILLGRTERGVGLDAFVRQERRERGASISFGYRLGVESEVVPHRLKLRGGTYLEPARYTGVPYRPHGTFGVDLRLFRFLGTDWRVTLVVDGARDYVNWGLSIGSWH